MSSYCKICESNVVKQGVAILPLRFNNYMNALFKQLKCNGIGCLFSLQLLVHLGMQMMSHWLPHHFTV